MGLPTKIPDYTHVSLPFRLYSYIYNEFFRDQNLQDSITRDTGDGPDTSTNYTLQKRNKKHDYITSGLPNLLKDPATAQTLPLGTSAPVTGIGVVGATSLTSQPVKETDGGTPTYATSWRGDDVAEVQVENDIANTGYPNIRADLTNATAATILQLRQAVQIQAILELDARAGTRYPEMLYSIYGVRYTGESYRPEFLASGSTRIRRS